MEEDYLQELQMGSRSRIIKKPIAFLYEIDLDDNIVSPSQYREERNILRSAGDNDVIKINFCCDGGQLDTTMSLVANLRSTRAVTVGVLESECHSGASVLFLCCDEHHVAPHTGMLIHEATYGCVNSADKLHRHVDFSKKRLYEVYHDVYKHFLSEDEIDAVLAGQDMWLSAEQIVERLEYRNQQRELEPAHEQDIKENKGEEDYPEFDVESYVDGKLDCWADKFSKKTLQAYAKRWKLPYTTRTTRRDFLELFLINQTKIGTDLSGILLDLEAIENKD